MINKNTLQSIKEQVSNFPKCELMIVTKNRSVEDIQQLLNQGFCLFGENRVQEAKFKYQVIKKNYELHLIGPLQSNKVKVALKLFDTIQTVSSIKLVDLIDKELKKNEIFRTKSFYIQVNIGAENQKSGVNEKNVIELFEYAKNKQLNIKGLMCIPPFDKDPLFFFEKMLTIRDQVDQGLNLSMGMSNDYEIALKCSSNMVRIGSKIFL